MNRAGMSWVDATASQVIGRVVSAASSSRTLIA
jgi:hypothetical protein